MQTSRLEINTDTRERAKHALRHYERFSSSCFKRGTRKYHHKFMFGGHFKNKINLLGCPLRKIVNMLLEAEPM